MDRVSDIEAAILGLLYEEPQYGYRLEKIIEERGMRNWTEIGFSSIYYVLKRLEKKDLIKSELLLVAGKPSRKMYTITNTGTIKMQEKVRSLLSEDKKMISSFDLGIAYLKTLETHEVIECLKKHLKLLEENMKFLEDEMVNTEKSNAPYFVTALFSRPLSQLRAEKLWTEKFIAQVMKEESLLNNFKIE